MDAEGRARVERAVAKNAGVALRLKHLQQADAVLREAMAAPAGVQDRDLTRRIQSDGPASAQRWRSVARAWAPLAAACLLGVLGGRLAAPPSTDGQGLASLRVDAALARALDSTPSGQTASVLGGEAEMALSFRTEAGVACRQFRLTSAHGVSDAVACRDDDAWLVRAQVAAPPVEGRFRTAGAGAGEAIDIVIDGMGAVMVLDEIEEAQAIRNSWR
ncbi:hypothetical protein U91I_01939 [alpha proteobacterium U9-1i]|nr:hypothetical protein U91I_01939 [alpha proteobacterium U9-1i]